MRFVSGQSRGGPQSPRGCLGLVFQHIPQRSDNTLLIRQQGISDCRQCVRFQLKQPPTQLIDLGGVHRQQRQRGPQFGGGSIRFAGQRGLEFGVRPATIAAIIDLLDEIGCFRSFGRQQRADQACGLRAATDFVSNPTHNGENSGNGADTYRVRPAGCAHHGPLTSGPFALVGQQADAGPFDE